MVSENIKEAVRKCNPQKAIYALGEIVDSFQAGITNAQSTADQAIKNAEYATNIAKAAQKAAEEATQNVGEAFDTARASPNSSTVIMEYIRINGNGQNVALPVVNTTNAGILNANDYKFFQEYDARIRAVEGVSKIYLVELPSDNPSSQQITLAYTSQWPDAPNPPLEGTVVVDPARNNLSYRWNTQSNTWYKISEVAINQFTNTTLGTIKGSTQDGEVQANADGTGSVTGWDTVKANITTLQENAISNARAVPSPTGVNLELINQNNVVKNTTTLPQANASNSGLLSPALYAQITSAKNYDVTYYVVESSVLNLNIGPFTISHEKNHYSWFFTANIELDVSFFYAGEVSGNWGHSSIGSVLLGVGNQFNIHTTNSTLYGRVFAYDKAALKLYEIDVICGGEIRQTAVVVKTYTNIPENLNPSNS